MHISRSTTVLTRRRFLALSAAAAGSPWSGFRIRADEPTGFGPGDQHRINWARASQGASVVESAEIHSATAVENLVGARSGNGEGKNNGTTIFADRAGQHERFVIDLGRERLIGRVFVGSHAPDGRRCPDSVALRGSSRSSQGPWRTLVADGDMSRQHTFLFDNTRVRFHEVDFGECIDGRGTRITSLGAFTRYRCPDASEVARWLAALLSREVQELKPFFAAADANRWDEAVSALRDVYARRVEERPSQASPRSVKIAEDMLAHRFQFGQSVHEFLPEADDIDWAFEQDYEWTNSLNRCGYWTHAVNVLLATGRAPIAEEIEAQLLHWIESCPLPPKPAGGRYRSWQTWDKPAKITWRSLDSAIRLWKLGYLAPIFAAQREHFSDRAFANLLYSIWEHLDYLSDDDWDGGNWLSTVTASVLDGALAFIEFRDGARWLSYAKSAFEMNVLRDVRKDGKEIENSTGYVHFAYGWDERVPAKLWCYVPEGVPIVTLLVPYRGTAAPSVGVLSRRITGDCTDLSIEVDNRRWHLVVDNLRCAAEDSLGQVG